MYIYMFHFYYVSLFSLMYILILSCFILYVCMLVVCATTLREYISYTS